VKTLKDLANEMQMSVRSVMAWSVRLNVPPTVPANACVRFSDHDAARLVTKWRRYWQGRYRSNGKVIR
jgi:hypothetical protein